MTSFYDKVQEFVFICFNSMPTPQQSIEMYTIVYQYINESTQNWHDVYGCLQLSCRSYLRAVACQLKYCKLVTDDKENKLLILKFEPFAKKLAHAFAFLDRTKCLVCEDNKNIPYVFDMIMLELTAATQK